MVVFVARSEAESSSGEEEKGAKFHGDVGEWERRDEGIFKRDSARKEMGNAGIKRAGSSSYFNPSSPEADSGNVEHVSPSRFPLLLALAVASSFGRVDAGERTPAARLFPTATGGREWSAHWDKARVVPAYEIDREDPAFRNEEGELRIADGIAKAPAGMTRLVVLTPKDAAGEPTQALWQNVEMTIYARRGSEAQMLDYQAFYLSARSGERHNDDVPCEGTSYHATARFDGMCGFKKELWHPGGYTPLRPDPAPKPWPTVPTRQWIGMKFICRNCDAGQHVRLELYLDAEANGTWKRVAELTDTGDWRGEKPGCDRPQNAILTEARPAVYFRTDQMPVELRDFSVREIEALK